MYPILLLEINEVPWRVIDHYIGTAGSTSLGQFFERAHLFTSVAVDTGELSPWVTWPTLHRGLRNEAHGIKNLGQDPGSYRGSTIWQDVRNAGGSIGICGSLQSWPPIEPGTGGFYIPDTFAQTDACIPDYLNRIQAFNLSQVRKNARVVNKSVPRIWESMRIAMSMLEAGVTLKTSSRIAMQLLGEKLNNQLVGRRSIFQTILFWDVFKRHFDPVNAPQFSTFFTNHIAGLMHRYWCDIFPEDFPDKPFVPKNSREPLMRFAMTVLDDMLGDVMAWSRANPNLVIILATSMGQASIHRGQHEGYELVVEDLALLMQQVGLARSDFNPLLAMAPQVAVEIAEPAKRLQARLGLEGICCGDAVPFIKVQEIGASLSDYAGVGSPVYWYFEYQWAAHAIAASGHS
jgi:hypothetical protein